MMEFFDSLGVETEITDMPVAVSLYKGKSYKWGTQNRLSSLLKQNLLDPYFYQMIREILKFKDEVIKFVEDLESNPNHIHSNETLEHFFPLCALIWSCPSKDVLSFSCTFVFPKPSATAGLGPEYFRLLLQSNCGVSILDFIPRVEEGTPHICLNHLNQSALALALAVGARNGGYARLSSSAAAAGAAKASEAVANPAPASANRNSLPNTLDCYNVCVNSWYLWMSSSFTLLRVNFIDSSK
ncbi:hypothetical protein GIB67_017676 [Kingdonia uniflora]|uniref:Uncharacterized protein n=1 Tax=Kingdonia uniflora TaxID=39325 RepID=A0A7J7NAS3_9MAGN|nr:hypothetical protein GIB67_017676 [Kingdonia uniflora]